MLRAKTLRLDRSACGQAAIALGLQLSAHWISKSLVLYISECSNAIKPAGADQPD